MADSNISEEGDDEESRTTPQGLHRFAFEYIDAAVLVADQAAKGKPDALVPFPAYYLALHGIELTLEAYLRHQGMTVHELRSKKYGHDLHACNRKARELGLLQYFRAVDADNATLALLVEIDRHQAFRYIRSGMYKVPVWPQVNALAVRLHQAVAKPVEMRTFAAQFARYPANP